MLAKKSQTSFGPAKRQNRMYTSSYQGSKGTMGSRFCLTQQEQAVHPSRGTDRKDSPRPTKTQGQMRCVITYTRDLKTLQGSCSSSRDLWRKEHTGQDRPCLSGMMAKSHWASTRDEQGTDYSWRVGHTALSGWP